MMTHQERQDLRAARNGYNSAEKAAVGYISGKGLYNKRAAEKELRDLLWKHRDFLVDAVSEPIG